MTLPYSKCVLTCALKRNGKVFSSRKVKDFLIRPRDELAFFIAVAACRRNFRSLSMMTPKSFSSSTSSKDLQLILYFQQGLQLPIWRHLHFPMLKGSCHLSDQSSKALMSVCSDLLFSSFRRSTLQKSLASSAKSWQRLLTISSISLIKITKRIGPNTDPWGIPLFTGFQLERLSSTRTYCD